jgi:hypothetical protein
MQSQGEIMVKNRKYTNMKSHNKKKTIAKCQYYERTGNSFFGFLRSRKVWLWWSTSLLFWRQRLIFRQVLKLKINNLFFGWYRRYPRNCYCNCCYLKIKDILLKTIIKFISLMALPLRNIFFAAYLCARKL